MFSEKKISLDPKMEQEPTILIEKSTDAPSKFKENPFYDPEIWGCAMPPFCIYLPDSDEVISFAVAAHEIGHLVKEGKKYDADLDNFDAERAEEQKSWNKGWGYLQKYVFEYYQDNPEIVPKIQQAFERIKNSSMRAMDSSKGMYLKKGALDGLSYEEKRKILKDQREKFFSEKGEYIKKYFSEIKREKNGVKPDWNKFVAVVKKAVRDIDSDNEKVE